MKLECKFEIDFDCPNTMEAVEGFVNRLNAIAGQEILELVKNNLSGPDRDWDMSKLDDASAIAYAVRAQAISGLRTAELYDKIKISPGSSSTTAEIWA